MKCQRECKKLNPDWFKEIRTSLVLSIHSRYKGDTPIVEHPGFTQIEKEEGHFVTGSYYKGKYNYLGFSGFGIYTYPHGAKYEGFFKDGQFDGDGTITYPKGQQLNGTWKNGKLIQQVFRFADGLEYSEPWTYCTFPDRSFKREYDHGFTAAGDEIITNVVPTKSLEANQYDTTDGYYNTFTKCVEDDKTHEILWIPTKEKERYIMERFRNGRNENVGYKPEFYEYWTSGAQHEINNILDAEKYNDLDCESIPEECTIGNYFNDNSSSV